MILRDRVIVVTGGGRDRFGNPIPEVDNGPYPASVQPLRSDEPLRQGQGQPLLVSFLRLYIGTDGGELLTSAGAVEWRGARYAIQGAVEPWTGAAGRVHHYEATLKLDDTGE